MKHEAIGREVINFTGNWKKPANHTANKETVTLNNSGGNISISSQRTCVGNGGQ